MLTNTSILPYLFPISWMLEVTASSLVTSKPKYSAVIPSAFNSSTLLAPSSSSIPFNTNVKPSLPNLCATENPIPPVAPVIMAIFPFNLLMLYIVF